VRTHRSSSHITFFVNCHFHYCSALRKNRWDKAFAHKTVAETKTDVNRKATIVIEHLIQASDVAHTMQVSNKLE
jgi:hypothetical protein